jgi:zinc transporter ZupT
MMTIEQLVMRCQEKKNAAKALWDEADHSPSAEVQLSQMTLNNSNKSNYYKTVPDESSTEELLAKNMVEAISPDSPSILKEQDSPRIYQNVPMVTFRREGEEHEDVKKENNSSHHHHNHYQHVERLMSKEPGGMLRLVVLYMAISIHSLFEGMALGLQTEHLRIFHLLFAILVHEALVAFSVGITMTRQRLAFSRAVKSILLFSTAVPIGILIGLAVQQAPGTAGSIISAIFQSLAAGIFIHVTFLELVPAEFNNSKDRLAKVAFHFIGFISLALVTITMGSHH